MKYLAAPFTTGLPLFDSDIERELAIAQRLTAINKTAAELIEAGDLIYSPVSHGASLEPHVSDENLKDHGFWMRHCLGVLERCDELLVLTLPGWDASRGVLMEIERAQERAIPINYIDASAP